MLGSHELRLAILDVMLWSHPKNLTSPIILKNKTSIYSQQNISRQYLIGIADEHSSGQHAASKRNVDQLPSL